jgi:hypothetical protein
VGNNLIDNIGTGQPLTWDSVTKGVWGAMIAGAIGGALGGLGGQFAQVLFGRLAPGLGKFAAEFAVDGIFDVAGGILGDLAAGNPITWESIVMGLAIGGAVNVSMGGMGALAKNGVNAPKTDVDAGTPRTGFRNKAQDLASKIQDFQGRMMETGQNLGSKAAVGKNAPSPETTKQGIVDANTRIQDNSVFGPKKNKGTGGNGDTDITTPKPQDEAASAIPETKTTTPKADGDGANSNGSALKDTSTDQTTSKRGAESEVKTENLEANIRAEQDLPGGHKQRINGDLDVEGCSNCDLLKRRYKELFDEGHIGMEKSTFDDTMKGFDDLKKKYKSQYGDAIVEPPTAANKGETINGKTREEIYRDYLKEVRVIETKLIQNIDPAKLLVVGDLTFEYTVSLRQKLNSEGKIGEAFDITASGIETRAEVEAISKTKSSEVDGIPEGGNRLNIMHEVDARKLETKFKPETFDKIVFNNPEVPGDAAAVGRMLDDVLGSAPKVLKKGGEVYFGLTGSVDAKGKVTLDAHLEKGTVTFGGKNYSVRKITIDPEHTLKGNYPTRRTEGGRIRTSRGPKYFYIFKLLN